MHVFDTYLHLRRAPWGRLLCGECCPDSSALALRSPLARRLKEVVYTLSNHNQNVMTGLWKDAGYKLTKRVKENWVDNLFLLVPVIGTYQCAPAAAPRCGARQLRRSGDCAAQAALRELRAIALTAPPAPAGPPPRADTAGCAGTPATTASRRSCTTGAALAVLAYSYTSVEPFRSGTEARRGRARRPQRLAAAATLGAACNYTLC